MKNKFIKTLNQFLNENYKIDIIDLFFSETHHKMFCNVAKKVSYQLGVKNPKFLGNGTYGVYFKLDNTKGLKITQDKNEVIFASKILNIDCKYIVKCYGIYEIEIKESPFSKKIYAIETELMDSLSENESEAYEQYIYYEVYVLHNYDYTVEEFAKKHESFTGNKFYFNYYQIYKSLIGIINETKNIFGKINLDIENPSNIGKNFNSYKLLDYGHTTKNIDTSLLNIPIIKINKII